MNRFRRSLFSTLLAMTSGAASMAAAPDARACGGFFCSSSPVDQTAEHILFSVNADHTITAYIQIQYAGDKDDFAWIVPAPGDKEHLPQLDASFPGQALLSLDNATQPQYRKNVCYGRDATVGVAAPQAGAEDTNRDGVTVYDAKVVGPYETVTLGGDNPEEVVAWLQEHQFRFTDAMIPLLKPYMEGDRGILFVAMRLKADKTAADIQPLTMTYVADKPLIPLRLTATAAQPEMGIVAWILADQRWAPENYVDLKIKDELIEFDQYGYQNNYLTLVSREADKVGGEAFVTEYAKPTSELVNGIQNMFAPTPQGEAAKAALLDVLSKYPYLTRLYTRMSAEEMIDDPLFMVASDQADVDNVHDLTDPNFDSSLCTPPPPPDPCSFNYCGRSGVCVAGKLEPVPGMTTYDVPTCVCANDATARATMTGANGRAAVYCEPVAMNLDAKEDTLTNVACEGFDCGAHGVCIAMNGNPTCQCEGGYGAITQTTVDQNTGASTTKLACQKVTGTVPALPRLPKIGQTHLSGDGVSSGGGCSVGPMNAGGGGTGTGSGAAALIAGLGALAVSRRRRTPR